MMEKLILLIITLSGQMSYAAVTDVEIYKCNTGLISTPTVELSVAPDQKYSVRVNQSNIWVDSLVEVITEYERDFIKFEISSEGAAEITYRKGLPNRMKNNAYSLWFPGLRGQVNCKLQDEY